MGRAQELRRWRDPVLARPPPHARLGLQVVLDPHPPQRLHRRHLPQPGWGLVGGDRREQGHAVGTDEFGELSPRLLALREPVFVAAALVPLRPLGVGSIAHPIGRGHGQVVERVPQRFPRQFQPVEGADGGQHVRGVGALPATGLEQAQLAEAAQEHVEQEPLGAARDQAAAELAEDRVVEAGVGQVQAEGLLPIDPATDGIRRLPIGKVRGELEDRHEGQPPGRFGGLAAGGKQRREFLVLVDGGEVVAHPYVGGDPGRFLGDGSWRALAQRRRGPPRCMLGSARRDSPTANSPNVRRCATSVTVIRASSSPFAGDRSRPS